MVGDIENDLRHIVDDQLVNIQLAGLDRDDWGRHLGLELGRHRKLILVFNHGGLDGKRVSHRVAYQKHTHHGLGPHTNHGGGSRRAMATG